MMEMFYILIAVFVKWVYAFVETHQLVYIGFVHFIVYVLLQLKKNMRIHIGNHTGEAFLLSQ